MAPRVKMFAAKPDNLNSIPSTRMVGEEDQLQQVVLWHTL